MGDVIGHQDAFSWSVNKIATAFNMDRRTVAKRLQECETKPAGSSQGHPVYNVGDAAKAVFGKEGAPSGPEDLDKYPEARKAWYQSENERLKFESAVKQLIPEADVARQMAFICKTIASGLDSLTDVLERDAGLDPDALILVTELTDSLRERMFESLVKGATDER